MRKTLFLNLNPRQMKRNELYTYNPQIYPRKLWIVKTNDFKVLNELFCYSDGSPLIASYVPAKATVMSVMEKESGLLGSLLWIEDNLTIGDMAHEAFHIAANIFGDVGGIIDVENQEPFAYLVGWATNCIYKTIRGK